MPNWCSNSLAAAGSQVDVVTLLKEVLGPEGEEKVKLLRNGKCHATVTSFSLAHAYPVPADLSGQARRDWKLLHWGSRDSVERAKLFSWSEESGQASLTATLHFSTPWSPPMAWVQYLTAKYPQVLLTLVYSEEWYLGQGVYEMQGERVLQDIHVPPT